MSTVATICARGGSQGVPRKNVRELCGKPLIEHTIQQALECEHIDYVFVSTDDAEIAEVAERAGASVPFLRPANLATSSAPKLPVIEHLIEWIEKEGIVVETIVDLDPTSPLRDVNDIDACIDLLGGDVDVVITGYESDKNPYFNMVEKGHDGNVSLVRKPEKAISGRQSAPKVYSMNASIYVWHRDSFGCGLWDGNTRLYEMPRSRSIDIDSEIDFRLVEMLLKEKLS